MPSIETGTIMVNIDADNWRFYYAGQRFTLGDIEKAIDFYTQQTGMWPRAASAETTDAR